MRRKTWVLGMQARKAIEYGGSSSSDLKALLADLRLSCPRDNFGSKYRFPDAQLLEIAKGLEAAGQDFIWEWTRSIDAKKISVKKEDIEKSVKRLMVDEEGEEMKRQATELKEMARKAVEEGGSSYSDIEDFLEEMRSNFGTNNLQSKIDNQEKY
ncbi:hypothetical protein Pint_21567 [Pistacia integerrima]|uniref:Uncharacterized protein n=1 Tax=Pistacia integerrima TaxID=434235 RepID=A0ACC0XAS5_9ROSI|nr:hypothetical protein Pint_21567 [Pistacia integerrima]